MKEKHLTKRSPVVAIVGHIDHGKSTLLSFIRKNAKPLEEAGGITQHISAYEVLHGKETITFLDTPGHEAFSGHRNRGVQVADIAILVVSAEDGIKQQTLEALRSIKENKIPFIVAVTKIDKPEANIESTKQSLAENNIFVEGYGGDIPIVLVSGKTGEGVGELLDMISLVADLENLTGDRDSLAEGIVIESNLDAKSGISATCIIKNGTIEKGNFVGAKGNIIRGSIAPVRVMEDWQGNSLSIASFSSPVKIIGWKNLPQVGSAFQTFKTKKEAEEFSKIEIRNEKKETREEKNSEIKTFPIIIKADTGGSLEAILQHIKKLSNEKIALHVIHGGIGTLSENDIRLAESSIKASILGFNVKVDSQAKALAERDGVEIVMFDVIYKLSEWLEQTLLENTPTVEVEEMTGEAKVLKMFSKVKDKQIIGCRVENGKILQGEHVRIMRRDAEIGSGKVRELQAQKSKISEVEEGKEFGAMVEAKVEIAPGDKLQAFTLVKR